MITVAIKDIRNACPPKTEVLVKKNKIYGTYSLHIQFPRNKPLSEPDSEQLGKELKGWLGGGETIHELFIQERGVSWIIYFKKGTIKFK